MLRLIRYLTMLFLILATFCHAAEAADYTFSASDYEAYTQQGESDPNKYKATPPIAGGSITGQFLELRYRKDGSSYYHEGIDLGVNDIGIYAPVDGMVWHGSGYGFGYGWVYFVSDDDAYPTKIRMLVGDLNAETASLPSGVHVSQGTQIGYVLGHDPEVSTGPHPHFQFYNQDPESPYAPFLNINGNDGNGNIDPGPIIDPYYMLTALGSDLTGAVDYSGPRGGETGADGGQNTSLTVASLEYVGNLLNKIVKDWTEIATKSIGSVTPYALSILTALCIIDLSIPLALGMFSSFNPNKLIVKAIRYASVFALIIYWPEFINNILISFIETFGTAFSSDIESITAGVTQPQLLLQKALFVITPAFQKIASFGFYDYKANFGQVIMIYIWTFFLAGVYIITAAYIALCWLEFYISAGLNVVTVPFSSWKMSKFIPEGMGGHLISSALKLLFISILVGMVSLCIKDQNPIDIFKMPTTFSSSTVSTISTGDAVASISDPALKSKIEALSQQNKFVGMIVQQVKERGLPDTYIPVLLSIAAQETGGGNIADIYMAEASNTQGSGLFQIDLNQDIGDPSQPGKRLRIGIDIYPNYKTDVKQNINAGISIYLDKLNNVAEPRGDLWAAAVAYNGGGDPEYYQHIAQAYTQLTGKAPATMGKSAITSNMLYKFSCICIAMIICAFLILLIPKRIMRFLGGPLELP